MGWGGSSKKLRKYRMSYTEGPQLQAIKGPAFQTLLSTSLVITWGEGLQGVRRLPPASGVGTLTTFSNAPLAENQIKRKMKHFHLPSPKGPQETKHYSNLLPEQVPELAPLTPASPYKLHPCPTPRFSHEQVGHQGRQAGVGWVGVPQRAWPTVL